MFAIVAGQIGAKSAELAEAQLAALDAFGTGNLVLPADRRNGDELQAATEEPGTALAMVLDLARSGRWSVGLGIGDSADGSAFTLARQAAARAKNRSPRFALAVGLGRLPDSELLEPLIDLVLHLRARRTPEGWEVHDLLLTGITQAQAAASLGVTPQAVSLRAQSARLRTEFAAQAALVRLLDAAGAPPEVG